MAEGPIGGAPPQGDEPGETPPWEATDNLPAPTPPTRQPTPAWLRHTFLLLFAVGGLAAGSWGVVELTRALAARNDRADLPTDDGDAKQLSADPAVAADPRGDSSGSAAAEAPVPQPTVFDASGAMERARVRELAAQIQTLQRTVGQLEELQTRWNDEVAPLLENEAGRRIAASDSALRTFSTVWQMPRIDPERLAATRQSIRELAVPIEMALSEENAVVEADEGVIEQLQTWQADLGQSALAWKEALALAATLARESAGREPAEATLQAALDHRHAQALERRAEEVAAQVEAAEQALIDELAASEIRLQQIEARKKLAAGAVEARRIEAEAASLEAEELALADSIAAQRQRAELERQFQQALPEIRQYLVPFISDGATQPRPRHVQFETAAGTGPVSFSKLKAHGVLSDTPAALFNLHALGAGSSNDRPAGSFPPYYGGSSVKPGQVPYFKKVQSLLRDYGDLMVEKGMLAP